MSLRTTSISADGADLDIIKKNDWTYRSVLHAGIKRLQEGDRIQFLEQEIARLKVELSRAGFHRDMIYYIFSKYPAIYLEARKITENPREETAKKD